MKHNYENIDFASWKKEHKDINNNLAVPSYRAFCKAYEIYFHFGDEIRDFNPTRRSAILLDEMPLHGRALSLFNFVNKPYHPFRRGLVSYAYTSWDDFDYRNFTLDEIAREMENKDNTVKKYKNESAFYAAIALISSSILTVLITIQFIRSNMLVILAFIINLALLWTIPQAVYDYKKKIEQKKFNRKLSELQKDLNDISVKYKQP